jgi:hypothetical protein
MPALNKPHKKWNAQKEHKNIRLLAYPTKQPEKQNTI